MATPALEWVGVCRTVAQRVVLSDVSLRVAPGEAVGLIGVNGAGKTTLMRALLDLISVDHGSINIFGTSHRLPAARARLSYLAERFVPPPYLTGAELLRHLLALHGLAYDAATAVAEASALQLCPAALSASIRTYSKGMAQKLGLVACVLARRPLLVLDEPMSGLDPAARALFKQRLHALKLAGTALFFSTHQLTDLEPLCDRVVLIDAGRVLFDGPPATLLAQTATTDLERAFLRCIAAAR